MTAPNRTPPAVTAEPLTAVRHSLTELIREVELERSAAAFAMEKLEQVEITKLYQQPRPRRALKSKKQ
jgi:hypothetical protein